MRAGRARRTTRPTRAIFRLETRETIDSLVIGDSVKVKMVKDWTDVECMLDEIEEDEFK